MVVFLRGAGLALALAFALPLASCASPREDAPPPKSPERAVATNASATPETRAAEPEALSLDALAALGPRLAPGMREALRFEGLTTDAQPALRAAEKDTCARIVWSTTAPVRASIRADAPAAPEATKPALGGTLGDKGPICVKKGGSIVVAFVPAEANATPAPRVRWVAWAAP